MTASHRGRLERQLLDNTGQLGYQPIPAGTQVGCCDDIEFLQRRFLASYQLETLAQADNNQVAVVTGFGPTNAPTLGTLSAMLAACELQRRSGLHTTIVVSDLGAWNSRNVAWRHLEYHRDRMLAFLEAIGFDSERGTLRTHQDEANLILSGRLGRFLTEDDFLSHREVLDDLYLDLGIRGPQLGVMLDGLYTIADIVGPLTTGHGRVLMLAGIEEHYFTELSRIVLERCHVQIPGELFPPGAGVAALFLGVVPGLAGHDKMSKSIPDSAVRLNEPPDEIRRKIVDADPTDDEIVLRMIELASDWSSDDVLEAHRRFGARAKTRSAWEETKCEYANHVLDFARRWADA